MTLDEAIEMSERIGSGDSERAANNRWLAEQLRLLKFVEETHVIDEAARARREMHEWQLMWKRADAENAKLRELLKDYLNAPCVECNPWREGWQGCKHCDGGNCTLATRSLELRIEVEE